MADLNALADSLGVEINSKKPLGKKRRSWLTSDSTQIESTQDNRVYKPIKEIGSINPIDQPNLNGSINRVDQPYLSNGVDQPYLCSLKNLRGNPLKLVQYFFEISCNNSQKNTPKITRSKIKNDLNITIDSVKTAIKFLLKNKFLEIVLSAKGKSGYSQYKLKNFIFDEIKSAYEIGSINRIYISSGSKDLNTTTIRSLGITSNANASGELLPEPEIDVTPLEDFGLTQTHVCQLINNGKLTSEQIQDSIYFFAFDITHNNKLQTLKKDALSFFMGILIQGRVYTPPVNYESLEAQSLRLYVQHKQREEQALKALEEGLKGIELQAWQEGLSEAELMEFYVPDVSLEGMHEKTRKTMTRRNALNHAREYFELEVWPLRKKAILEKQQHET